MAVEEEEREGRGGKGRRVKWRGRRERKRGWNGNGKRNGGVRRLGFGRLGSLAWQTSFGFFFFSVGKFWLDFAGKNEGATWKGRCGGAVLPLYYFTYTGIKLLIS